MAGNKDSTRQTGTAAQQGRGLATAQRRGEQASRQQRGERQEVEKQGQLEHERIGDEQADGAAGSGHRNDATGDVQSRGAAVWTGLAAGISEGAVLAGVAPMGFHPQAVLIDGDDSGALLKHRESAVTLPL